MERKQKFHGEKTKISLMKHKKGMNKNKNFMERKQKSNGEKTETSWAKPKIS